VVYKVPESKKSIGQNQFEFELPDGMVVAIPKAKFLTAGQIEQLATSKEDLKVTDILDLLGQTDDAKAAVRQLDIEQLMGLMQAWQEDSGIALGES
jgi:hypothetical protein